MNSLLRSFIRFVLMKDWFKLKDQEPVFYTRFINEDNLEQINDLSIQSNYYAYLFSIFFCSFGPGILPSIGGFNTKSPFSLTYLVLEFIAFFIMFFFTDKFIQLDKTYHVFKKKYYVYLFSFGYWLLDIIFAVIGYLTTKVVEQDYLVWNPTLWPIIIFFIPLLIIYHNFCKCACGNCFEKYLDEWARVRHSKKD